MKNWIFLLLISTTTISCNFIAKDVENAFGTMDAKLDSIVEIENQKVEILFEKINSRQIPKQVGENSALVYYSLKKFNKSVDSLINGIESGQSNGTVGEKFILEFENQKLDFAEKIKTIATPDKHDSIDLTLAESKTIDGMPIFSIIPMLRTSKVDAAKITEGLLIEMENGLESENNN